MSPGGYPLVHIIINRIYALIPLPAWETCASNLVEVHRPSSITFVCKSFHDCPSNDFYKMIGGMHIPMLTISGIENDDIFAWPVFRRSDMVFVALHDDELIWGNKTIQKYRREGGNEFKLILIYGAGSNDSDPDKMGHIFEALWKSGLANAVVLLENELKTDIFTYLPYKNSDSCEDTTPVMLGDCKTVAKTAFDLTYKVNNFNKCPFRVSLFDDRPFFDYPFSGKLTLLISELSERMNFTIEVLTPADLGRGGPCGPEESEGIRAEVATGKAHMVAASLSRKGCSKLEYISLVLTHCSSWCTPVLSHSDYVFEFLFNQLQPAVWTALLLSIFAVVTTVQILRFFSQEKVSMSDAVNLSLLLFAPVSVNASTSPVRLLVGVWLYVCLVLRTAYESEMKSQSSAPQLGSYIITDLNEMADMEIRLCTTPANRILFNITSDPVMLKLYAKIEACNESLYDQIKRVAVSKDYAVFTSDLRCAVMSAELGSGSIYTATGGCFKSYEVTPFITLQGSPFNRRMKKLIQKFTEAGLTLKWLDPGPLKKELTFASPYGIKQMLPSLFILSVGNSFAFLIFAIECVYYRRPRRKRKIR